MSRQLMSEVPLEVPHEVPLILPSDLPDPHTFDRWSPESMVVSEPESMVSEPESVQGGVAVRVYSVVASVYFTSSLVVL